MGLVDYAKRELALIGSTDDEMQQHMNTNVLQLIEVFANQGHSGFSASYLIGTLERLMRFKPLNPLTGTDDEWNQVSDDTEQNKRCSSVFRNKLNNTAYDIEAEVYSEDGGETWSMGNQRKNIIFPYTPPTKPKRIILSESEE